MAELLFRQTRDNTVFLRFHNQIRNVIKLFCFLCLDSVDKIKTSSSVCNKEASNKLDYCSPN